MNENSRVAVSSESIDAMRGIRYALIKTINYEVAFLKEDRYATYLKHDTPLLAGLVSLMYLPSEFRTKDLPLEQVEEWENIYVDWFTKKQFRSEKAKKHNEMTLKTFDDLKKLANPGKILRDIWVKGEKLLHESRE